MLNGQGIGQIYDELAFLRRRPDTAIDHVSQHVNRSRVKVSDFGDLLGETITLRLEHNVHVLGVDSLDLFRHQRLHL